MNEITDKAKAIDNKIDLINRLNVELKAIGDLLSTVDSNTEVRLYYTATGNPVTLDHFRIKNDCRDAVVRTLQNAITKIGEEIGNASKALTNTTVGASST